MCTPQIYLNKSAMHNSRTVNTRLLLKLCVLQNKVVKRSRLLLGVLVAFCLNACGSSHSTTAQKNISSPQTGNLYHDIYFNTDRPYFLGTVQKITDKALEYRGTPYEYGGTDNNGIDCSGLIYNSFQEENVSLPRISRNMAKRGYRLKKNEIETGDLLFFQTGKSSNRINHVGLVVERDSNAISFIHATTSRGVIVSTLKTPYWSRHFVKAKRVLE